MTYATLATRAACAALLVLAAAPVSARPRTFENADPGYTVTVPAECRTEEGSGTLDVVCATDFGETASASVPAVSGLVLEVDAEKIAVDSAAAARAYSEAEFRQDVPEAVCGEADNPEIKLDDVAVTGAAETRVFSATVTCPPIAFLSLAARTADVRYIITPTVRYRLMARSLSADAAKVKAAKDAFLTSFKPTVEK